MSTATKALGHKGGLTYLGCTLPPTDMHGKSDLPEGRGSEEEECTCDPPTLKAHLTQEIQILWQHPGTHLHSQMSMPQPGGCSCDVVYFIFSLLCVLPFSVNTNSSSSFFFFFSLECLSSHPQNPQLDSLSALCQALQGTRYCLVFMFLQWTAFPCLQVLERPWREIRSLVIEDW